MHRTGHVVRDSDDLSWIHGSLSIHLTPLIILHSYLHPNIVFSFGYLCCPLFIFSSFHYYLFERKCPKIYFCTPTACLPLFLLLFFLKHCSASCYCLCVCYRTSYLRFWNDLAHRDVWHVFLHTIMDDDQIWRRFIYAKTRWILTRQVCWHRISFEFLNKLC